MDIYRNIFDKAKTYSLDYLIKDWSYMCKSNLHLGLEFKDFCDLDIARKKLSLGVESTQKQNPALEVFCHIHKESPVYSSEVIKALREYLGYNDAVISDCLSMCR